MTCKDCTCTQYKHKREQNKIEPKKGEKMTLREFWDCKDKNIVVHCDTKEKLQKLCAAIAEEVWDITKDKTCYERKTGSFVSLETVNTPQYTFVEIDDYKPKNPFTKDDLQEGDVVVTKGAVFIVQKKFGTTTSTNGTYAEDLTLNYYDDRTEFDIQEVYRPKQPYQVSYNDFKDGTLVFKREQPKEMTVEEIEKKLGYKIKIVDNI